MASISNKTVYTCLLPPWYPSVFETMEIIAYAFVTPLGLCLGVATHVILLIALMKHTRHDRSYNYLVYLLITELFEIVSFASYSFSYHWCADTFSKQRQWCTKSYGILFYGFRLSFPLWHSFITVRLLLSIAAAADRLLALWKPFAYKNFRHKLHQRVALAISLTIGVSTSIFDCFRYNVAWNPIIGNYEKKVNTAFTESLSGVILSNLRNLLRATGLFVLLFLNFSIIRLYKRANKINVGSDDEREIKKRSNERALTLFTLSQSIFTTIDMTWCVVYYALKYMAPEFSYCAGQLMMPASDTVMQITATVNLFIVIWVSKPLRSMVIKTYAFGA